MTSRSGGRLEALEEAQLSVDRFGITISDASSRGLRPMKWWGFAMGIPR